MDGAADGGARSGRRALERAPAAWSLVPWAAFLAAMVAADPWVDHVHLVHSELPAAGAFYLVGVALPAALPLVAARPGAMRLAVLAVMTATAAAAGVSVIATDDAQAGLAVLLVSYVGLPLAAVLWLAKAVISRPNAPRARTDNVGHPDGNAAGELSSAPRSASIHGAVLDPGTLTLAEPSPRCAALAIDVLIVGVVLVVPLTMLSHAGREVVAAAVGAAAATAYLGAAVTWWGRSVGQRMVGLQVVGDNLARPHPARAFARSLIIVIEVAGSATIILLPVALAELFWVGATGRSVTDRLLGTAVVADVANPT